MFEYKSINLKLLNFALAAAIGLGNSSTLAKTIAISSSKQAARVTAIDEANLSQRSFGDVTVRTFLDRSDWLLADNNSAAIAASENDRTRVKELNPKLVRSIALLCFLLLFVPLGIFYPLFLFYRQLLNRHSNFNSFEENNRAKIYRSSSQGSISIADASPNNLYSYPLHLSRLSSNSQNNYTKVNFFQEINSQAKTSSNLQQQTVSKATVSKLQIAFSPPAKKLRRNLSQITSNTEQNTNDIAELMRKAVSVLLMYQQYWTHVSYSSDSFPLDKLQSEFEMISYLERNKCLTKELGVKRRATKEIDGFGRDDSYNYVVVTLILCTSHNYPLFDRIYTEAQLIEELLELGQMKDDRLSEFELLWNPQRETEYISNKRLLTQYSDLTRLL